MQKMLLVSPRTGTEIAAAEYGDLLRATHLTADEVDHIQLDSTTKTLGDISQYAGIIVGGSPLNVTNDVYSDWQHHVHAQLEPLITSNTPVFFICYGNTLVTKLSGGDVDRNHPESAGSSIVELTAAGRQDPLTKDLPERFTTLTGHTENAVSVGPNSVVLATGPTCPIQIMRTHERTWSVQFHPEMDAQAMKARMDFYFDYGYFSPDAYESIVATLPQIDTTYSNQLLRNFVDYARAL